MARHPRDSPDYDRIQLPQLVRAIRYDRELSQRELAERAGLPHSTVARIESGATNDPAVSTLQRILAAAEYSVAVIDFAGAPISHFSAPGPQRDATGRHLPAHLERRPLDKGWWGWYRTTWEGNGEPTPDWIFNLRYRTPRIRLSRTSGAIR
jgi:transcriptional regulator with XRE-family HTH domain